MTKRFDAGGKFVPVQNLHITLVFIGDVDESELQCLKQCASGLSLAPFNLQIDLLGSFGKKALWLGCQHIPAELFQLHTTLKKGLQNDCGRQLDSRSFIPHITLQRRLADPLPRPTKLERPLNWSVKHFSLIQSKTGGQASTYSELACWDLV